jgi:predicted transcriptional regulator
MKFIENIQDLKKGDNIIVKDNSYLSSLGHVKVKGEVFSINEKENRISIKSLDLNSIDEIRIDDGKIFLV